MSTQIGANSQDPNPLLALTLATIAYGPVDNLETCLNTYAPGWTAVWIPDQSIEGIFAFIAYNGNDQYVVAIRGSELDFTWDAFDNWFLEDLNVFFQVPWAFPNTTQNPMISLGASDGLTSLTSLVQTTAGGQTTILDYLTSVAIPARASIGVVGHSLGGCMSTVLAPWLLYQFQQANQPVPALFPVMTFAAPSAGNQAFAQAFDNSFLNSWRYYNELDIVPMASASISDMGNLYPPGLDANQIVQNFTFTIFNHTFCLDISLADVFWFFGVALSPWYCQTNITSGSIPLNQGHLMCSVSPGDPLVQWFDEAGCQHITSAYFLALGQDNPVVCG